MRECHRILMPGGVLRISTPDLRGVVRQYLRGAASLDCTPGRTLNDVIRGNLFLYDQQDLMVLLQRIGFQWISPVGREQTHLALLQPAVGRGPSGQLYIEAMK